MVPVEKCAYLHFFFCRSVSQSARFCGASVPHAVCGSLPQLRPKPQRAFFFSFLVAATADFANNTLEWLNISSSLLMKMMRAMEAKSGRLRF